MGTLGTIDIDALLAPVSESAPTGEDLRRDVSPTSIYFRLKDARSGARAAERRADSSGEVPGLTPEWQTILSVTPKALTETSKDLEIVAWYLEALVRAHGFAGLRDGLRLARGLVERYWDNFFSLADEEGLPTRLAPLTGLNGQGSEGSLIQPLRKVPITEQHDGLRFATYHFDQARALANVGDAAQRSRREAAGEVSMEVFMAAVNSSGGAFYISLLEDLDSAQTELALLATALDERAGRDAPPTRDIAKALTTIRDAVATFSADLIAPLLVQGGGLPAADDSVQISADAPSKGSIAGPVRSRDDALRVLQQVADYFRHNEPHSPIATSLDELGRRAKMPFAELLAELVPDTGAWRNALMSAGIKPPPMQ